MAVAIKVEQLQVNYGSYLAVDNVELQLKVGEVTVIVGPNGCGKSTLLQSMARLHRPFQGQIWVNEQDIWQLRPAQVAKQLALLPQSPEAPGEMSVLTLIQFGRHPHQGLFRQWSADDEQAVQEAMAKTGVSNLANRSLQALSGGQRQRCWLAMVLAQQTPVVLLDEPTSMLDPGHQLEVLQLVRTLARQGKAMVLVLHDLIAAARFADNLVAMRNGKVVASGAPREILTSALVRQLYDIEADILMSPEDDVPVVVAKSLATKEVA
ncbi:ABC transporter ATP-binding protein [Zooshikella sp. WH53]|uniref:ABC transporter ATP-binding protein n=2 Tax=Zooshikella harenae TaxID=2827238 RepID=A0ABS5ZAS0_9GAMM|nr:ABC transporter ATP-binding protein [Zooshikella harenae]